MSRRWLMISFITGQFRDEAAEFTGSLLNCG